MVVFAVLIKCACWEAYDPNALQQQLFNPCWG